MADEYVPQGRSNIEGLDEAAKGLFEAHQRQQSDEKALLQDRLGEEAIRDPEDASGETASGDDTTRGPQGEAEESATTSSGSETQDAEGEEAAESEEPAEEAPVDDVVVDIPNVGEVKLSELSDMVLMRADYTRKMQELGEQRREVEAQGQQVTAEQQAAIGQLQQLSALLQQEIQRTQLSPQQWAELEQTDPGQAALLKQQVQDRQRMLMAAQQAAMEQQQKEIAAQVPKARAALMESSENFRRDFDAHYAKVGAWATSAGNLSVDEWNRVIDPRLVRIAEKAMLYDATNQATRSDSQRIRKKVAALPKVRPSVPKDAGQSQREELDRAMAEQERRGGDRESTAAAFMALQRARK